MAENGPVVDIRRSVPIENSVDIPEKARPVARGRWEDSRHRVRPVPQRSPPLNTKQPPDM